MRHYLALLLATITMSARLEELMLTHPLQIEITCAGQDGCTFDGQDVVLSITLTNHENRIAHVPLEFYLQQGPIIKVRDRRTGEQTSVRRSMGKQALRQRTTALIPGGRATFSAVIPKQTITSIIANGSILEAEITFATQGINETGEKTQFLASGVIHIELSPEWDRLRN
jgi:hypothetical protein